MGESLGGEGSTIPVLHPDPRVAQTRIWWKAVPQLLPDPLRAASSPSEPCPQVRMRPQASNSQPKTGILASP